MSAPAPDPIPSLQELAAEVKRLRAEVEQLKKEKVSWCQEILNTPEDKRVCRDERDYLPEAYRPMPWGPLSLNRCAHCGVAMTTTMGTELYSTAGSRPYATITLCSPCGVQHKRMLQMKGRH